MAKKATTRYDERDMDHLPYPICIQRRPGMYVGGRGATALHHLAFECIDNAVDEGMAGFCHSIEVTVHKDGSLTVNDDGRGVPTGVHQEDEKKRSWLELSFSELHSGGKFREGSYSASGGTHGVGVKAANALSRTLEVEVRRDGVRYRQRYEEGLPVTAVLVYAAHAADNAKPIGEVGKRGLDTAIRAARDKGIGTGTTVTFQPNPAYLETVKWEFEVLRHRLQAVAYLVPGVRVTLRDERGKGKKPLERTYCYDGGIAEYVRHLNHGRKVLHTEAILIHGVVNGLTVEAALQWHDGDFEEIMSFVNTIPTPDGGTHLSGLRAAVTKAVNQFAAEGRGRTKEGDQITGTDATMGLTCVLHVKLNEPEYDSQTKTMLRSPIQGQVMSVVYDALLAFFRKKAALGRTVIACCLRAARARQEAAKARELVVKGSTLENASKTGLPEKLADVSRGTPREQTTLYIVEGNSAGGSCKQGRDRRYHAILPLRGKVLNVEKDRQPAKVLGNAEIRAIIAAIGGGAGREFTVETLRYGQVAILADSDVDGAHIQTLLLTLFLRQMRPLIEAGRLYLARAPFYQLRRKRKGGDETRYAYTDEEREAVLAEWGPAGVTTQRYKGLGELNPRQLSETVFALGVSNPGIGAHMVRVTLDDVHAANEVVALWMGSGNAPLRRRQLLRLWQGAEEDNGEEGNGELELEEGGGGEETEEVEE